MQEERITGKDFRNMIIGSYHTFMREHELINSLNVFPVPDGDTGTNMLLTLSAIVRALAETGETGIGSLSKRSADSAIMGARGNSGVILSQIFRGIARGLAGKQEATSSELGKAFQYGILYAYRAVAKPVEGTILTVAKGIAKGAHRAVRERNSFADILTTAIAAGEKELKRTPQLLPALKQAGVVDAGGKGLLVFLTGCLQGLIGEGGPEANIDSDLVPIAISNSDQDAVHPYCTEFIVKGCSINEHAARAELNSSGESLIVAQGDGLLKVHIHTANPGFVLEKALTWGTLHDIKIDNMADQHRTQHVSVGKSGVAVISVVSGEGLMQIMRELGSSIIIPGGQTMNPPVEDFVEAVHNGSAEKYIILPNNKNIILAAKQAKKLLGDLVEIVPTANIPQGMAALLAFDPAVEFAENTKNMSQRINQVTAGALTAAVRDSQIDGWDIKAGNYIGIKNGKIVARAGQMTDTLMELLSSMVTADSTMITLYFGEEVTEQQAQDIAGIVEERYTVADVEVYKGGQPNYLYIISVE